MVRDLVTEVRVLWRAVNGAAVPTYVPRAQYDVAFPLYVRHTPAGWGVYHAGSHMLIRGRFKRDQAITFLQAIQDLADWRLPVDQIVKQHGLIAHLDSAAARARTHQSA